MGTTVTRDENTVDKRRINGTNLRRVWHQYEFNFETTEQSGCTEIHTQYAVRDDYCSDIATEIIREWTIETGGTSAGCTTRNLESAAEVPLG